ncbi:MAG: 16S rRNA (guanine(527)-N(7))-methyltransferase RsmG [Chloroflexi bacterium]|nr:16S rRNA (guanine(527)-N(7))-methyltransferase RsmG [Chloroflexota bacterium]
MSQTGARAARVALERLLDADEPSLPAGFGDRVEAFVRLLLEANARTNLTRIVEPDAVARLHLLDALSGVPLLDMLAPRRALDLGSGGGVPGIVLALARPDVSWTLVDSVRKKADVLRGFVELLELATVAVVAERAEIMGRDPDHREHYDLVTARACAALPVLAEYALPLVRVGGAVLAWKGAVTDEELRAGQAAAVTLGGELEVRGTGIATLGDHRFVLMRKGAATPNRYPRRPGEPAKRPLG